MQRKCRLRYKNGNVDKDIRKRKKVVRKSDRLKPVAII